MAVEIYFEEGFVDTIIADAEKAGKPLSDNDKGFLRAIDAANRDGVEVFPYEGKEAEEISKKVGQIMVDNVANFSAATHKDYDDFVLKTLEEHGKFVEGAKGAMSEIREGYDKFHKEMMNDFNSFREGSQAGFEEFRNSATSGFGNSGAHGGGMQGVSDFINAGFTKEEKEETHAVMSAQRDNHDAYWEATKEALSNGEWQVVEVQAPVEHVTGHPKEEIYAPGYEPQVVTLEPAQENVTGVDKTPPRLVGETGVTYWVDKDDVLQIDNGDSRTKSQAEGIVHKNLKERKDNGEELHPSETKFMEQYQQKTQMAMNSYNNGLTK